METASIIRPGGAQTRVKLSIVGDYLGRFTLASRSARDRIYIDGLAGSGSGIDPRSGEVYNGSGRLCFDVDPPFTECYLIERDGQRAASLERAIAAHSHGGVICGDVNEEIPRLLERLNAKAPTFAFLDPEGTELHWSTIEALAAHKRGRGRYKVELLILFPLQMAVRRLLDLKAGVVKPGNAQRLDLMLGATTPWREIIQLRLLGALQTPEEMEHVFLDAYAAGLKRRLGCEHVLHCAVASERGVPLYYLVFASDCDVGERIMKHEFGASHTEQGQLFNLADYTPGLVHDPDRAQRFRSSYF